MLQQTLVTQRLRWLSLCSYMQDGVQNHCNDHTYTSL